MLGIREKVFFEKIVRNYKSVFVSGTDLERNNYTGETQ